MDQGSKDVARYIVHTKGISQQVSHYIRMTSDLYHAALNYVINVCVSRWDEIRGLDTLNAKTYVESLIHSTKNRSALYPSFDRLYHKFPSYLRRDVIMRAIGHVSSFVSNTERYDDIQYTRISNGMRPTKRHAPKFCAGPNIAPSFYKDGMYVPNTDGSLSVKLWNGKDWCYYRIKVKSGDAHYIAKKMADGWKMASPSLVRSFGHWVFAYVLTRKKTSLTKDVNVIVGVDLGIGNDAVCSAMLPDGTVTARRFIKLAGEKDRLEHLRHKKRGIRAQSGRYASLSHINTKILGINMNIACQTAHQIAAFAEEVHADVVVFEHLSKNFKGSEKTAQWRNMEVFHKTCGMLHRIGIRYATVSPKYTSRLAFDGSGWVKRGRKVSKNTPYDVCRFKSGKIYNCDLNASYNIGARYLMRLLKSTLVETEWSRVTAKVPDAAKRTRVTLSVYRQALAVCSAPEE